MSDRPTYTVRIWRDPEHDSYWLAQLDDEPGCTTFGRSIGHAKATPG